MWSKCTHKNPDNPKVVWFSDFKTSTLNQIRSICRRKLSCKRDSRTCGLGKVAAAKSLQQVIHQEAQVAAARDAPMDSKSVLYILHVLHVLQAPDPSNAFCSVNTAKKCKQLEAQQRRISTLGLSRFIRWRMSWTCFPTWRRLQMQRSSWSLNSSQLYISLTRRSQWSRTEIKTNHFLKCVAKFAKS